MQPNKENPPFLIDALNALAGGQWINRPTRPAVRINSQPSLFETTLRDRFVIDHPLGIPCWPADSRFSLDFVTDDPIRVPFLQRLGVEWCAPCHALISQEGSVVATVTGILTFESWVEEDQHSGFFELVDFDEEPRLAALSSIPPMELSDSQRALECALKLVYGIECADGRVLCKELERLDDWSNL